MTTQAQPGLLQPATHPEAGPTHRLSPVHLGLLLEEGADLLEGGSAGRLQGPAGLHDAVSETGQKLPVGLGSVTHTPVHTHAHALQSCPAEVLKPSEK